MIEKPDKAVAESIQKMFTAKKLLKKSDSENIASKLSSGNISEQDWKLMAELSLENKGEGNAKTN